MSFENNKANKIANTVTEIVEPIEQQLETREPQPISPMVSSAIANDENDNNINNNNSNNNGNIKSKKFMVGNGSEGSTSSQELSNNVKEVGSHRDTESRGSKPYPAEEIVKAIEEKKQSQQKQKIDNDGKESVRESGNTDHTNMIQIPSGSQHSQQSIQQPTPKDDKVIKMISLETSKPTSMTPTEPHQAAPVVTNTTVTTTIQQQPTTSTPLVNPTLSTPAASPPDSSLPNGIHNATYVNGVLKPVSNQSPIQSHHIDNFNGSPLDDSYSSEPLNFPHQPRFPPSGGSISRTQQKLFLQRQHFLADDENYLIHPRNQLRLTKVIERINREHAAILLYREPIIESLQRVWPKYVLDHPEVMNDDFGVEYEDAKDWGVISDHGKNPEQIVSNSMISTDLGINSV